MYSDRPVVQRAVLGVVWDPASDLGTLLVSLGAGLYFQAISALVLVLYGALRSIEKILPIGPLKDGALTRPIDQFVLEWFGDVYVLLRDPAQAASVRGRLIDAIRDLEKNGCSPIDRGRPLGRRDRQLHDPRGSKRRRTSRSIA